MLKKGQFASLKADGSLEVTISKEIYPCKVDFFYLYIERGYQRMIKVKSVSESNSSFIYSLPYLDISFTPGKRYELSTPYNDFIAIDISVLAISEEFDKRYRYDGILGSIYSKEKTSFRVFSPLAESIALIIKRKGDKSKKSYMMHRDDRYGIYQLDIAGDLEGAQYLYRVEMFSNIYDVVDPYSKAVNSNSRVSYVIDESKIKEIDSAKDRLSAFDLYSKAIIYECCIRDSTSKLDIPDKGTFNAFSKYSIPYIKELGFTHIQLLPVLDFSTTNDDDKETSYNWGYDPNLFFTLEGSYSTNPDDPYARCIEFKNLVREAHLNDIRVIMDVVYNHLFSTRYNSLNLLVPEYYLRHLKDGSLDLASGCGNVIESKKYMARKLIIDSLSYLLDVYDVDGFRFDLMGLLDVETINKARDILRNKKRDIMLYGEGWDMPSAILSEEKACIANCKKLNDIAFFNDRFRDVVKGKTNEYQLAVKGYLLGDTDYIDGFKHVMKGSSSTLAFAPLFDSIEKSINFVECHDNHTLYDKIRCACPIDTEEDISKRIKMISIAILFSCGIPLFHQGQETGYSKNGEGNSYNKGDEINGFSYELLEKRKDMVTFLKEAIKLKKELISTLDDKYALLDKHMFFENMANGGLKVDYIFDDLHFAILFNPTKSNINYPFKEDASLLFNSLGDVRRCDVKIRLAIVNPLSADIYLIKRGK